MNRLLKEMKLRELPDHLIDDYLAGRCSSESEKLVEALRHLPENYLKFLLAPVAEVEPGPDIGSPEEESGLSDTYDQTSVIDPAAGQIWSVKNFLGSDQKLNVLPIAGHQLVFLLTNPNSLSDGIYAPGEPRLHTPDKYVEFLPVSFYTEFANHEDMIFPAENDLLGVEFMIETGVTSLCLEKDLDHYYGTISQEDAEKLLNLYFRTNGMEFEQDLIDDTILGNRRELRGTVYDEFKEIEFENAQIIAEPVEKLRLRLEEQRDRLMERVAAAIRIPVILSLARAQAQRAAAAVNNIDVAAFQPDLVQDIHKDENLLIAVNRYDNLGYYFNIVVASEICDDTFDFRLSNAGNDSLVIERKGRKPGEYFFEFDSEMKTGIYDLTVTSGSTVLFEGSILLEIK